MNLGELRTELKSNLGNRTSITDARYDLWLNNTQIEIASAFQFYETETWKYRDTVVGSYLYALPSDLLAIYSLRDNTNKRKIMRTHYRKVDNIDFVQAGLPTRYLRFGNNIMFNFNPSAIVRLYLRYCTKLTAMSADADEPTLNQPWHECILLGAEWRGWKALSEVKKAAYAKTEYLALVRSRKLDMEVEDSDEEFGLEPVSL